MTAVEQSPFGEVEARYADLVARYEKGELTAEAWSEAAAELRCADANGTWWQLSVETGRWLWWDGQAWQDQDTATAPTAEIAGAAPAAAGSAPPAPSGLLGEIISGVATTTVATGKSTPRMLLRYFLARLPIMGVTFGAAWLYHTYLLVFPNGGFNPDTALSRWINVSGNAASASVIWGCGSALLWSFVYSIFAVGPVKAIQNLVTAPQRGLQLLTSAGRGGIGAFLVGSGLALALSGVLHINQTASFTAAGVLTLMGLSQPGWLLSTFVVNIVQAVLKPFTRRAEGQLHLDAGAAQLVVTGLGPGFMLAGLVNDSPSGTFGAGLVVAGLFLWLTGRGARPSLGQAAAMLLAGTLGAALYWLLEHLLAETASADDGGADECSKRNMIEYMAERADCAGSDTALNNGLGPATSSAVTTLTPPLDQEKKVTTLSLSIEPAVIRADGTALATASATIDTNDPKVDAAAIAQGIQFSIGGPQGGWVSSSATVVSGATAQISLVAQAPAEAVGQPGPFSATVEAAASGPTGPLFDSRSLMLRTGGDLLIEMRIHPDEKRSLRPDGKDHLWVYARVVPIEGQSVDPAFLQEVQSTLHLKAGAGGDWINVSAEADEGDERYVTVWTVDPGLYTGMGKGSQPNSASIVATATVGEGEIQAEQAFEILPMPEVEVEKDTLRFLAEKDETLDVRAWIVNGGGGDPWEFDYKWEEVSAGTGDVEKEDLPPEQARFSISTPNTQPGKGGQSSKCVLTITAKQGETELVGRSINVFVVKPGLAIDTRGQQTDGSFTVTADGKTVTDVGFAVWKWDEGKRELVADRSAAETLEFGEAECEELRLGNAIEVVGLEPKFHRLRDGDPDVGEWSFKTGKAIPYDGQPHYARMMVMVPGEDDPAFEATLWLGLKTAGDERGSLLWEEEIKRCHHIIDTYLPEGKREEWKARLQREQMLWGAEGLAVFRHEIWDEAMKLLLDEKKDYENEAYWWDWALFGAEKLKWITDRAFNAATMVAFSPYGGIAVGMARDLLTEYMVEYFNDDGKPKPMSEESWEDWIWSKLGLAAGMAGDLVVFAPHKFQPAYKGWAVFVVWRIVYHYCTDLGPDGLPVGLWGAVKAAGYDVGNMAVDLMLAGRIRSYAKRHNLKVYEEPPPTEEPVPGGRPQTGRPPADQVVPGGRPPTERPPTERPPTERPPTERPPTERPPTERPPTERPPTERPPTERPPTERPPTERPPTERPPTERPPTERPPTERPPTERPPTEQPPTERPPTERPPTERPPTERPPTERPPGQGGRPTAPEPPAVRQVRESMHRDPTTGKLVMDPKTAIELMGDPQAVRTLKKAPREVQEAFENTRQKIYEEHDSDLVNDVWSRRSEIPGLKNVKGKDDIKVMEFRQPKAPPKPGQPEPPPDLNTDRDYRLCKRDGKDAHGNDLWVEIDRRSWQDQSARIFAEKTGGPKFDPANPEKSMEAIREWSAKKQQLGTDKYHTEASIDMSDQAFRKNPETGQWERTQVQSNVSKVQAGKGTLQDPEGLGKMWETKVRDPIEQGWPAEGYKQAQKGVEQLTQLRSGYVRQGFKMHELPPNFRQAMKIVGEMPTTQAASPEHIAQANQALRELHFDGIEGFSQQLRSQFESFKGAQRR